jgi:raffinose/stachyose/melibiose transport system substrate-binding protein
MWNEDEPQGKVLKQAIDAFEAANPHVTLEVMWNGRDNRNLIVPALEAGETIDVFDTGGDWLAANVAPTYALSLEKHLVVMMPYNPFAVMFFYNKDHFDGAGVSELPETWEEFVAVNQALKETGNAPITTDVDAYIDIIIGYYVERALGCDTFLEAMADRTGEAWSDPMYLQMAQDIRALWDEGYIAEGTEGNLYPAGQQALALGEVSMYLNGTWLPTEVQDTAGPDFRWGAFSFPAVEGGVGSAKDIMMGSQAMIISNASAHPDEAFEFIKYVVSKDVQAAMVNEALVPAVHADVEWTGNLTEAGKAVQESEAAFGWACDIWNGGEIVGNVVLPTFTDLFVGKLTPEEYVNTMVEQSTNFWAGQQ